MSQEISLDMNDRERTRFAKELTELADACCKCADALTEKDDAKLAIHFCFILLAAKTVTDLQTILIENLKNDKKESDSFPDVIYRRPE